MQDRARFLVWSQAAEARLIPPAPASACRKVTGMARAPACPDHLPRFGHPAAWAAAPLRAAGAACPAALRWCRRGSAQRHMRKPRASAAGKIAPWRPSASRKRSVTRNAAPPGNRPTATLARLAYATKISRPMRGCSPSLASLESQRHLQIVELANELRHPTAAGLFFDPAQMRVDGIQTQLARVGIFAERDAGLQGLRQRRFRLGEAEYVTQGRRRGGIVAARVVDEHGRRLALRASAFRFE